jgi:hypothetical protein
MTRNSESTLKRSGAQSLKGKASIILIRLFRYDTYERIYMRYLQGTHWKYPETVTAVADNHKWRSEKFPFKEGQFDKWLNMGFVYALKRDTSFRPVVYMNVDKMIKSQINHEEL